MHMSIFIQQGVTCELIMLAISVMMLVFIVVSKPRKTLMLMLVYAGFAVSIVTIVSNMTLLILTDDRANWNYNRFLVVYVIFVLSYCVTLGLIFNYIDFLSYMRRTQPVQLVAMLITFAVIFITIMMYPAVTGRIVEVTPDRVILTHWYNAYVVCGLIDAVFCLLAIVTNRKTVSPVVLAGGSTFIIVEMIILIGQLFCDTAVFTSATYVLAFLIFYLLFHCATYDEVIGCQNSDSFYVRVDDAIKYKKRFITVTVFFPALEKKELYDNKNIIDYCASLMCRELEKTHLGIGIYCHNSYTYSLFCEENKSDTEEKLTKKLAQVFSSPIYYNGQRVVARYKMIIVHDSMRFSSAEDVRSVIAYERNRFLPNLDNEIIDVDDEELARVEYKDRIDLELYDIRNHMDLDDERVLCFAQPIFCIETGTFRSAEALMRMKLNDEIVYPDKYISVAEANGTIHVLTLIMLNKVCKFIKEIEKTHDFDAITVNCSTIEMDDRNLHKELIDIITKNEVDPRKIRLEITESLDMSKYDNVLFNMQKLNEFGIEFYLDDFGTGYSNLERIVNYPFHTIKFDKNILYKALNDNKADAVLDTTVKLFQESGFNTVVEGVEDQAQSDYVKEKGFKHIQGYMYSKPQEIQELKNFFEEVIVE